MSFDPRIPRSSRSSRPSRLRRSWRALRLAVLVSALACALAPGMAASDVGVALTSVDAVAPLAPAPEVPRIVMRSQVEAAAAKAGMQLPPGPIANFRIVWDGGEAVSLGAPERLGPDAIRFLRVQADGSVSADTVPMSRLLTIGVPPKSYAGETVAGVVLACGAPFAVSGANPVHIFTGMGIWGMPFSRMPEFRTLAAQDYFNRPGAWTGSVSATLSGIPRTALNPGDARRETVPAWKLEVEAGSRRSAAAFFLSLRMLSMNRPWTRDPPIYRDPTDEEFRRDDSMYLSNPTAYALSPGLRLTWAETERFTLFSQTGIFFGLTPYRQNSFEESMDFSLGPELGAGFNWWLTKSFGVRGEGALLVPVHSSWDFTYEPSLGAGFVYRYDQRPAPSFQHPVTLTLMTVAPIDRFAPMALMEAETGRHHSAGIGTMLISSEAEPAGLSNYQPDFTKGRYEQVKLFISYGVHSDRSRRAYAGVQFLAGLESITTNTGYRSVSETTVYEYNYRRKSINPVMALSPEAVLRLGRGFGLRMQWHLLPVLPVLAPTPSAFAAGFTYTLPGSGERR